MSRMRGRSRAPKGYGIRTSGTRISIGGFDDRRLTVTLWPGHRGSRKVFVGAVERPLTSDMVDAFSVHCSRRLSELVVDRAVITRLVGELDAYLERAFVHQERQRAGITFDGGPGRSWRVSRREP